MKHRSISDLRSLSLFGFALLFCVGSVSLSSGFSLAQSGVVEKPAHSLASAIGAFDGAEVTNEVAVIDSCADGIDSDNDGLIDCEDSECFGNAYCTAYESSCSNTIDDDGDGHIDCADIECVSADRCKIQ